MRSIRSPRVVASIGTARHSFRIIRSRSCGCTTMTSLASGNSRLQQVIDGWSMPNHPLAARNKCWNIWPLHYAHRLAISNERWRALDDTGVTLQWKDYRQPAKPKLTRLDVIEFIRRFLLHVLPAGFQRIRHFGWLANRNRKAKLALCRELIHALVTELLPSPQCCQQLRQALDGITSHPGPQWGKPARPPDSSSAHGPPLLTLPRPSLDSARTGARPRPHRPSHVLRRPLRGGSLPGTNP